MIIHFYTALDPPLSPCGEVVTLCSLQKIHAEPSLFSLHWALQGENFKNNRIHDKTKRSTISSPYVEIMRTTPPAAHTVDYVRLETA